MAQAADKRIFGFLAHRGVAVLVVALLAGAVVACWRGPRRPARLPAVVSESAPRVAERRCAECHPGVTESFHLAPHSRTLHRATDDEVLRHFAGRTFHREDPDIEYRYEVRDGRLVLSTPAYPRELPIEWIFGSGMHAQTPLMTWADDEGKTTAIEHIVSWYPHDEPLGITLGMEKLKDGAGIHALGRHWGPAETVNCFGCHSTHVPVDDGRVVFERLQPNISCARCHWDVETHVRQMEAGEPATIERFSEMSPRESVERCGECHRRAGEMGGPVTPDNKTIVRFAPVGLVQSPCFLHQESVRLDSGEPARLDCTTCHDPHRPARRDWRFHVEKCLTCHDAAHARAADCSVATRKDNCLPCHMPAVPMNSQLDFTDHWIRVREL